MRGRVRVALATDPQLALVRLVVVDACLDAFLFGKTGETVLVQAVRRATMLPAVAVKLLLRLVWGLLGHHASRWVRRHLSDVRDATRPTSRRRSAAVRPARPAGRTKACSPARGGCCRGESGLRAVR